MNLSLGMVHLIGAEPTLLPVAPADDWATRIEHRVHDEVHSCLRCGERARCAYVAETRIGPRWLDLCPPCTLDLRRALDETVRWDGEESGK